jgi:hypothetical protein
MNLQRPDINLFYCGGNESGFPCVQTRSERTVPEKGPEKYLDKASEKGRDQSPEKGPSLLCWGKYTPRMATHGG